MLLFRHQSPAYLGVHTFTINRAISSLSLGAIYQSRPQCAIVPLELPGVSVACEGKLTVQEVLDIGVTPTSSSRCYLPRHKTTGALERERDQGPCQKELRYAYGMKQLRQKCVG